MKKFVSVLLCAVMLFSFSAAAFADGGEVYKMEMEPDVKRIYDAEGGYALLAEREDILEEFHRLRNKVGVNWDLVEYEEMSFEIDADGNVKALSQYIIDNKGGKIVTEDPNVAFIDSPDRIHATGAGETRVIRYDAEGNEVSVSNIKVSGTNFKNFQMINECSKCLADQGSLNHYMSCGHYSCEVGREGHGDAVCGTFGHYACDGADHSICYNCQKGLCNGREHGFGVCPHVHTRAHFAWDKKPTCQTEGVERIYCPGCGSCAIVFVPPVDHVMSVANYCIWCGQSALDIAYSE